MAWLAPLNHVPTQAAVTVERSFLAQLGGGCSLPVAAYAIPEEGDMMFVRGRVTSPDGTQQIDVEIHATSNPDMARGVGAKVAQLALNRGASRLLEGLT
jgi:hydroxymethylbilane synthase